MVKKGHNMSDTLTGSQIADCWTDLLSYTECMFKATKGSDFEVNWHHKKICHVLEKLYLGDIENLLITIPPRYSKTLLVINFLTWSLGLNPDSEFIFASYAKELAANNAYEARNMVLNAVYTQIFPDVKLMKDSKAKHHWKTTAGGVIYAAGTDGTIRGFGAGKKRDEYGGALIIDDASKGGKHLTDVERKGVIDWYNATAGNRLNHRKTPRLVIGQRLHEEDLPGWLLAGGDGREWYHLNIPVLDEDENPLWESMHTKEDLLLMRKMNPYHFASQYMQDPAPLGGGMFKEDWWQYYDDYNNPPFNFRFITADTAQKTKEHNDYSVFQLFGMYENKLYLIDQKRGKWEAPELRQTLVDFWNANYNISTQTGKLRMVYVEDKSSGTGLIQDIQRGSNIPIKGIPRHTDKVTRAMDGVPHISTGQVFLPKNKSWLAEYIDEFSRFSPEMTHKHDDQIDATLDAINLTLAKKKVRKFTF